jgi:glutathione S-transferase
MKLHHSPTSPFVRKVMMAVHELGLADRVELLAADVWGSDRIRADNPLGKVPALLLDDGSAVFDSPLICEVLDLQFGGGRLYGTGAQRLIALKQQAAGDGICDAAVARRIETAVRPENFRWPGWVERQQKAVAAALDLLEREAATLPKDASIGMLSILAALSYLDLRFPQDGWRDSHAKLAAWYDQARQRPSFIATEYKP